MNGKRASKLARSGEKVELKRRKVKIFHLKILNYIYLFLKIETKVSGGSYIRVLAEDIGKKLGIGAYLYELIRISVGNYLLKHSLTKHELVALIT